MKIPSRITLSVILGEPDKILNILAKSVREVHLSQWKEKQGVFSASDIFHSEPPFGSAHKRKILISKSDNYVFFSANLADGWNSLAFRISRRMGIAAFVFGLCTDEVRSPGRSVMVIKNGQVIRAVSLILEDKWIFYQEGNQVCGEKDDWYKKRSIRTRLTNELIIQIAESNKIDLVRNIVGKYPGILLEEE